MTDNIKLPLVKATDHPEPRVMQWSALELAEINRLMREAVRLNAQAVPEPAYVELPDDIRVPLDSVFADAGYLIGRLLLGTMSAAQVIRAIQDKIEVAKAATRTALSAAPAAPQPLTDEKDALLRQALEALEGFIHITNDSQGVAGYHLSGDTAEWDEFDEVDAASNTIEAIREHLGVKND